MRWHLERLRALYDVLVSHCDELLPPGTERNEALKHCVDLWNEINNKSHYTEKGAEVRLTGAIYDGLAYGNWPWTRVMKEGERSDYR